MDPYVSLRSEEGLRLHGASVRRRVLGHPYGWQRGIVLVHRIRAPQKWSGVGAARPLPPGTKVSGRGKGLPGAPLPLATVLGRKIRRAA